MLRATVRMGHNRTIWNSTMAVLALMVVFFAALACSTDAQITGWEGADDPTNVGAGIYTFEVQEGIPTADPALTVTAISDAGVTYTLADQTPADGPFTIDTAAGVITFTSPLDFETSATHIITITAFDGTETDPAVTATATVTINVEDVVSFTKLMDSVCVPDGTAADTEVTMLPVPAGITGDTYAITAGNDASLFKIEADKVLAAETLDMDASPHTLTIIANGKPDELELTVQVGDCSAASLLAPLGLLTLLMALIVSMN